MELRQQNSLSRHVVAFCRLLREQGVPVGTAEEADALRALTLVSLADRETFRLTLRTVLAGSQKEQQLFDALFSTYWAQGKTLHHPPPTPHPSTMGEVPASRRVQRVRQVPALLEWLPAHQGEAAVGSVAYSPLEVLSRKDFSTFTQDELNEIRRVIFRIARSLATRPSRRYRPTHRRDLMDLRRTMRLSLRRGGEMIDLAFRQRRIRRLKLVLLCDVSGSMELYSRFLLLFLYALQRVRGQVETFVFSTALHRVTDILKGKDFVNVLNEIAARCSDWSGGTQIGACLHRFLEEYGDALINRQTTVIILSDGWDTGEIEQLEESMKEIHRRAKQIIWLNPLLGSPHYEPTCRGMQVALPFIDLFAPIHNLESLRALARHLAV